MSGRAPRRAVSFGATLLAALALAGCASSTASPAQRMQQWANAAGYSSSSGNTGLEDILGSDLASLAAGVREHDLNGLRTACAAFSMDADNLYGQLPTPDETLTDTLATALTDFANAGTDCYEASSFQSAKFESYERELRAGTVAYNAARERLKSFGVR